MFGIGMPEMILILAIALIVIGPKKLPDLAKSLGRALGEFKKATSDLKHSMEVEELSEVKSAFNELNQDINQSLKGEGQTGDTPAETPADPQASVSEKQADQQESLDDLKKAFDGLNQEGAPPSEPTANDVKPNDPLESSGDDDSDVENKGSMQNE